MRTGEVKTAVHRRAGIKELQQFDRGDFQRIALHFTADVHAKVVFLVRCFERFYDLGVAFRIELEELLILRQDAEATRCTL